MHAGHADRDRAAAPPVTRSRQRVSVDIECAIDIDGLGAAQKHQRVLRASPSCICAGYFSVLPQSRNAPFPAGCRKFVAPRSGFEG